MDIADETFTAAVTEAMRVRTTVDGSGRHWATCWDVAAVLAGHLEDVGRAPQDYPGLTTETVRRKARDLIRRGMLDGCDGCDIGEEGCDSPDTCDHPPCTCRGSYSPVAVSADR